MHVQGGRELPKSDRFDSAAIDETEGRSDDVVTSY
jgi:hypothetical protein